jgi:hypothetical protein
MVLFGDMFGLLLDYLWVIMEVLLVYCGVLWRGVLWVSNLNSDFSMVSIE